MLAQQRHTTTVTRRKVGGGEYDALIRRICATSVGSSEIQFPSSIANYFDTDTSKLNPYNIDKGNGQKQPTFVYGTLPLFTNKVLAEWLDEDANGTTNVTARPVIWPALSFSYTAAACSSGNSIVSA